MGAWEGTWALSSPRGNLPPEPPEGLFEASQPILVPGRWSLVPGPWSLVLVVVPVLVPRSPGADPLGMFPRAELGPYYVTWIRAT